MLAKCLRKAINIKASILEHETKARATNKKATNWKKRLLEVQEALRRAYEKIDHFCSKCTKYILEKTMLREELKKLSEKVSQVTWDVAVQVAHLQN